MDVVAVTNPIAGGWNPQQIDQFLTANEESVALWAAALRRQGADSVTVYTSLNCGPLDWQGVRFEPLESFGKGKPADVLVSYKYKPLWLYGAEAPCKLHWSVDVEAPWAASMLRRLNAFVCISNFQVRLMPWLVGQPNVRVSPLGFDMRPFREQAEVRQAVALYTSSPDRGLETLLEDWGQISVAHPELKHLLVTYDVNRLATMGGPGGAQLTQKLQWLAAQYEGRVQFTGPLHREVMVKLLKSASAYIHPLNRAEADLCGYGAQKAALGGCRVVLNGLNGTSFEEFLPSAINYRSFLHGKGEVMRSEGYLFPAQSWDVLVREFWLPLMEEGVNAQG